MRRFIVTVLLIWLPTACILQTETIEGSQGDAGPPGPIGMTGVSPFHANADESIFYMDGAVGIGTMTPNTIGGTRLDVKGGISVDGQRVISSSETVIGVGDLVGGDGKRDLALYAGDDPRVWIAQDNGFVGIGTPNPAASLHVDGDVRIDRPANSGGFSIRWPATGLAIEQDDDIGAWATLRATTGQGVAIVGSENVACLTVDQTTNRVGVGTLDIFATAKLTKYSAQPFVCSGGHDGTIALTSKYKICVCNGDNWVPTDGSTPLCSW